MVEEVQMYLEEAEESMQKAMAHTQKELTKIRAGKASPAMLDGLMVAYYGADTPINQVATVNTPDARSIIIKPFEKSVLPEIEKSIKNSDLGMNPQNDGEIIRLNIPPLTEERRKQLVKQVKQEIENGKIGVRTARKDTNNALKGLTKEGVSEDEVKKGEDAVQKLTDKYNAQLDDLLSKKEGELMSV